MKSFEGKVVVVTGGAGALGSAVVGQLIELGALVHVPAFDEIDAERFPLASDPRVTVRDNVDLADEVQVERFYASLPSLYASVHVAGGFVWSLLADTSPTMLRRMLNMNTVSAFLCCREAVKRIREGDEGGRIVNVSAKPALVPTIGVSAYAASKAGVAALTQCLSEELAAERIWVNAVVPSIIDTPQNRAAMPDADHGKWPSVDDVAQTVVFLASPSNASTRGALVPVFGRS